MNGAAAWDSESGYQARLFTWLGFLTGPAAWALHLVISYGLVEPICETGDIWVLHVTTAAMVALALAGAVLALRGSRTARGQGHRFLCLLAVGLDLIFAGIIVIQGLPNFFVHPCVR